LTGGPQPLSWSVRMKVAIGAARGLSFLHNAQSQVIYRDFKASNILLDAVRLMRIQVMQKYLPYCYIMKNNFLSLLNYRISILNSLILA